MNDEHLIERVSSITPESAPIRTALSTDQQVFARITDGIYRQPSSALRELISNAYDADATLVTIDTDAPRFDTITVRDNGNGMSAEALANLVHHIGGSLKRRAAGTFAGVNRENNPELSPAGRRLIGKIGIGLFAVAQLTQRFQIITKQRGTNQRLVATIELTQYTEDELKARTTADQFQTGRAEIIAISADDTEAHGTDIILLDIKPPAKRILRSTERWQAQDQGRKDKINQTGQLTFHIGRYDAQTKQISEPPAVPWLLTQTPSERFLALVEGVIAQVGVSPKLPTIREALDNYLETLWTLSLSSPVDYVGARPWDLSPADEISGYSLDVDSGTSMIDVSGSTPFSTIVDFSPKNLSPLPFEVSIDGLELRRPIVFRNLSRERELVTTQLLFADDKRIDLADSYDNRVTGGSILAFTAYLFWTPRVVPKENNGVLIRINNASGMPFDSSFMNYRTNEQQRMRQFTAEIFVSEGLDAALNIDRESFNFAHPHYQILSIGFIGL